MLENILSIIIFELEATLVGWIMYGRNIDEARESGSVEDIYTHMDVIIYSGNYSEHF